MRRSTRRSSIGIGLAVEERFNSNSVGNFSTRFSLSSFVKRVEKLTNEQTNAINKVGFGNLLSIPNHMMSKNLLVELMERWNPDECGFMLLPGMLKITLMDVALILGIRVVGDPILLREDEPFSDLESDYGATLWKRKITVGSLESRLDSLGEVVNEDFVRTFILFTFGTILFPNASGKVDSRYLSFLKSLDDIGQFAWGAAVLEDMFMWLNKRKVSNVQYIGGCLILLQVWSYEHIDLARPDMIDGNLMFPRACRWENSKSHQRQWFTSKFKELQNHQITWQLEPTSEELQLDVVNELLEVENSSIENSSDRHSIMGNDGFEIEQNFEKVQHGEKVNLKQSIVSQYIPKVQTVGFPSASHTLAVNKDIVELSSSSENSENLTKDKNDGFEIEQNANKVQQREEVSLKQSIVSQHIPEVQTVGSPSASYTLAVNNDIVELSSSSENSENLTNEQAVELYQESDVTKTCKIQVEKRQSVHLKQSKASRDIPEVETEVVEFPSPACALELSKDSVDLSNSEKLTRGNLVGLESVGSSMSEVQVEKGQEVNLKQSTNAQHLPEVETEAMPFPSTPGDSKLHEESQELSSQSYNSDKLRSGNEEELIKRNWSLEVENKELRKEVEALKLENTQLKMHIRSTNDLVTRLEGLVMDDAYRS